MNHITLTEDGMKLLVRVMRRADWMLSVSGALEANRIVNDVFVLPTDEQKELYLQYRRSCQSVSPPAHQCRNAKYPVGKLKDGRAASYLATCHASKFA